MGRRTSAARSVPGNALAGVLRGPQRNARAATRRVLPAPQPDAPESEAVAPVATMAATVLACDSDGVARWDFPAAFPSPPVVTATPAFSLAGPVVAGVAVGESGAVAILSLADGSPAPEGTQVNLIALLSTG